MLAVSAILNKGYSTVGRVVPHTECVGVSMMPAKCLPHYTGIRLVVIVCLAVVVLLLVVVVVLVVVAN